MLFQPACNHSQRDSMCTESCTAAQKTKEVAQDLITERTSRQAN